MEDVKVKEWKDHEASGWKVKHSQEEARRGWKSKRVGGA